MAKHQTVKVYEKFDGDGKTEHPTCPRCGSFLADHDNRKTCGKCGFSEIER